MNVSAPLLVLLDWMVGYDPSSVKLGKLAHLHWLGIELSVLDGEDVEAFANNRHRMKHLRGYERVLDSLNIVLSFPQEIGTSQYSMEDMPRLPNVVFLALGISSYGHSFAASSFDVLRSCPGIQRLDLDFLPGSPPEERTSCPSGCVCHHPQNWRTDELVLNCLEEVEIHDFSGTEYEVALVKKLFDWATVLNLMTVYFAESITESKVEELRQLLLSFSRPDICMKVNMFVP